MTAVSYTTPTTLREAAATSGLVSEAMVTRASQPVLRAGGIDLLGLLDAKLLVPSAVVDLRAVPGLDAIEEDGAAQLHIGAMVTLGQVARHPLVRRFYPALAAAAAGSASAPLRNVATLGGNLLQRPHCWYFRSPSHHCLRKGGSQCFAIQGENQYHAIFDNPICAIVHPSTVATALVALKAEVVLEDWKGGTRRLVLEDFFVGPDEDVQRENRLRARELLTRVMIPRPPEGTRMLHRRQGEKDVFDWPLADVAVVLRLDRDGSCREAAVVLGAAAPVPYRARAAERALLGRQIDHAVAEDAAKAAMQGATPLSRNREKLPLFETLVRRAILAAV